MNVHCSGGSVEACRIVDLTERAHVLAFKLTALQEWAREHSEHLEHCYNNRSLSSSSRQPATGVDAEQGSCSVQSDEKA